MTAVTPSPLAPHPSPLEVVYDLRLHPNWFSVRCRAGTELGVFQDVVETAIVSAIGGAGEFEAAFDDLALLVDLPLGDEVKAPHLGRDGQRRDEELRRTRGEVRLRPAARARANPRATAGTDARPDAAT